MVAPSTALESMVSLLQTPINSQAYCALLAAADRQREELYGRKAYIFAQLGLNAEPCSVNCQFCSMAAQHYAIDRSFRKSIDQVVQELDSMVAQGGISDLFLMTTADYPQDEFLRVGEVVRRRIASKIRLVANIGDFDLSYAQELKRVGFTGAYHIVRLGEGQDTQATVEQRMATIDAIEQAGLELYYCIEPIGPEHTPEQIAQEVLRAKELGVEVMAVMKRTPVAGTPLYNKGEVSEQELLKIAAITALTVQPKRSMNIHEVHPSSLQYGINQLYAECGANPRDTIGQTEQSRGYTVEKLKELFTNHNFIIQ